MLSTFNRELEQMDRLETDYIRILCYDFKDNFKGTYRSYEYSRLCTILQGEKLISVNNNETFKYDRNSLLLLSPNSKIDMSIHQPTKAVVFELNNNLINKVNEKISNDYFIDYSSLASNFYYVGKNNNELKDLLNRISNEILKKDKKSEYLIDLYAQELVYHLIQNKSANLILNAESNNPINKAIRYMNNNDTQPVDMKQLSYDLNMSESYFCQLFKKITKMTPNDYYTNIKLEKAKELLNSKSVTETAYDLGYSNISYFIFIFKKKYGMTPKQYKKAIILN